MIDYTICAVCKKKSPDYEPVYCCNGQDCACQNLPIFPCICSDKCEDEFFETVTRRLPGFDEMLS